VTTATRFSDDQRREFIRYTRTRRWPMLARYPIDDALHLQLLAQMLACAPDHIRDLVADLDATARDTATDMLADPEFAASLAGLPWRDGDRVVAVGDSITADRLGWFEMLAAAMRRAGTAPGPSLLNLGVSGNTTADVLERFDLLEAARPTVVLMMLGTNDARAHGRRHGHRMASPRETERNLRALVDIVVGEFGATVRLITPPAVDQNRSTAFFTDMPLRWHAETVAEVADVVRAIDPDSVDVHEAMLAHGLDGLMEADGVHPSLTGQRFLLGTVATRLAASARV